MTVKLTLRLTKEQAERLVQANKDGKLSEYGIIEMKLEEPGTASAPEAKWVETELKRKDASKGSGGQPLP